MVLDLRRESARMNRELDRFQEVFGESVVWFRFDTETKFDNVYDTANRQYHPGIEITFLYLDQLEDPEQYSDNGRRPTMRLRGAIAIDTAIEMGLPADEAHGNRTWDSRPETDPPEVGRPLVPWIDDRNNDVLYYDGRFWAVSNFQIRGRMQGQDQIIGVTAIESDPTDEMAWDEFPWVFPSDAPPETP